MQSLSTGRWLLLVAIGAGAICACYVAPGNGDENGSRARANGTGSAGDPANASTLARGLPCEVASLLAQRCQGCHRAGGSGPMPLRTYDDLSAPSVSDPSRSTAEVCLDRMTSPTSPMPPSGPRIAGSELEAFRAWVSAKLPRAACGGVGADGTPAGDPNGGPTGPAPPALLTCSSGRTWSSGKKGSDMDPGRACISCHEAEEDKPVVWAGGTVYPSLHERDLCFGVAGARNVFVVITDAHGRVVSLPVGPTGNFSLDAKHDTGLAMPIHAKVVRNGVERAMKAAQTTGDCNSCHTEQGANGAPGRIMLP